MAAKKASRTKGGKTKPRKRAKKTTNKTTKKSKAATTTLWAICLDSELARHPDDWPIARDFDTEAAALAATSVSVPLERLESRDDYEDEELKSDDYFIDSDETFEPGKVFALNRTGA